MRTKGYVCGFFMFKNRSESMKNIVNKKLFFRSGLFLLIISAIGGGAYLADQTNDVQEEHEVKLKEENPAEIYIQSVYATYSNEIVATWNDLANENKLDTNEVLNKVKEWKKLLAIQGAEYDSLNVPIKQQINTIDKFLEASQEEQTTEQRKVIRRLSFEFVEGHNSVKEGFIKLLEENDANFTVNDDDTITYQFPK